MKCYLCHNETNNQPLVIKEMMYGLKDAFEYLRCSNCGCIHIVHEPENMAKYYPNDYYSYIAEDVPLKRSTIRSLHFNYYTQGKNKMIGRLLALKFKPSLFYTWLEHLHLSSRSESVLDIGCGNGRLLKRMYRLGFNHLTGTDPFLKEETVFNPNIKLLKKEVFELNGTFDVIMMHHSLEHMSHQQKVVKKVAALLSEKGRLLIRIPIVSRPLMEQYGTNVASLDAPRHFYIHSLQSISQLLKENNLTIYKTEFDAEAFSILASEQYAKGISNINDKRSYIQNPGGSVFTPAHIKQFEEKIKKLNEAQASDSVALYIKKEK